MVPYGPAFRDRLLGVTVSGSAGVRYHLRSLLGEGGQGWVYQANYGEPGGFSIVVKVLRPEGLQGETLQRFEREAEVLRMLGAAPVPNPNIVRFYDHGRHVVAAGGGEIELPFIVLEYVDGTTLGGVIEAHGGFGLSVDRARRVIGQVANALSAVHENRVVHRDLKPSNVLLSQVAGQEVAKVTDFGLAKSSELGAFRTIALAGATLGYAPPEQYEMGNDRVGVQSDVFSFAAILFETLCGEPAFPCGARDNPLRMVSRMMTGDRPALSRHMATVHHELRDRPELLQKLDREIARATSADPSMRHASIREIWEAVEPILRAVSDSSTASSLPPERSGAPAPSAAAPMVSGRPMASAGAGFRVIGAALEGDRLRAAVIGAEDGTILGLGATAMHLFAAGAWTRSALPGSVDLRALRGLARMPNGELLLYGDAGLAAVLGPSGRVTPVPLDVDVNVFGACVSPSGIGLACERVSGAVGAVAWLRPTAAPWYASLEGTRRIQAVLPFGEGLIACGPNGALVVVSGTGARHVPWGRTGHLFAVAPARDGGAYCVGSGGHALRISPPSTAAELRGTAVATLEPVQTTRDLTFVTVDDAGCAWACGDQARLLQRRGGTWVRIPLPHPVEGPLVALSVGGGRVLCVSEAGLVVEGPAETSPPGSPS